MLKATNIFHLEFYSKFKDSTKRFDNLLQGQKKVKRKKGWCPQNCHKIWKERFFKQNIAEWINKRKNKNALSIQHESTSRKRKQTYYLFLNTCTFGLFSNLKFSKLYNVEIMEFFLIISQCGDFMNLLSRIFGKSFVKATFLLKKLLKTWFDEIFFQWE